MPGMTSRSHWESIYEGKGDTELSWTQPEPRTSLALVAAARRGGSVIDVGGGTAVLADRLLDAGYEVAVLDISQAAIDRARARLGVRSGQVRWFVADVTSAPHLGTFDVWHDRAVFHFLTEPAARAAYAAVMSRTVPVGGHAVIATFALDGPEQCSGLPVRRYAAASLAQELGDGYELVKSVNDPHVTPWGKSQSFQYSLFRRC
jgi:SAM-dependent methyltransferase